MDDRPIFLLFSSNYEQTPNCGKACFLLELDCRILQVSSAYWLHPHIETDNPRYNWFFGVIKLITEIPLLAFHEILLTSIVQKVTKNYDIEIKNKFMPLALEILLWKNEVIEEPQRNIYLPSPLIMKHAHIAAALAELEPNLIHPLEKLSLKQISDSFDKNQRAFYKNGRWLDS
jgi:7,8-dihydro-6-hydroxymethylpterin-pyrophosphokinase